jgi:hypothetical protein
VAVSPSVTTVYSVTGKDANGCAATKTIQVTVSPCLGIQELNTELLTSLYPNPNNGTFSIDTKLEKVEFKTKGSPMNYGTNKNNFINLGSLISDGNTTLDNTTEYKIIFTSTTKLDNILGLISIGATDAVNKAGTTLKVKVK